MIRAIIETSFVDWDGKISTVLFFDACNFRCPFCHNWELITKPNKFEALAWDTIKEKLHQKKGWVDGVVLTGGEPLMHEQEVTELCEKINGLGIQVKIDTNGAYPHVIQHLLDRKLVHFFAMDVKAPLDERYNHATGAKPDLKAIQTSITLIMQSTLDYEFRTTCVPGIVDEQAIHDIGKTIKGARKWALQAHVPDNAFKEECRKPLSIEYPKLLHTYLSIAQRYVPNSILRGKI
jgi:pyruvate formate lyase activating enzyme